MLSPLTMIDRVMLQLERSSALDVIRLMIMNNNIPHLIAICDPGFNSAMIYIATCLGICM